MLLFQPRIPSPLLLWKVLEDFIPQVVIRLGTQGPDIFLLFWLPGSSFYRAGLLVATLRLNCPVASSLTRDQTCNPFTGQWITTGPPGKSSFFLSFFFFFLKAASFQELSFLTWDWTQPSKWRCQVPNTESPGNSQLSFQKNSFVSFR